MKSLVSLVLLSFAMFSCTSEAPECIEIDGQAMYIQEVNRTTTDRLENIVYNFGGIDTFSFSLRLKNNCYYAGLTEGEYTITGDMIHFRLKKDYCPDEADCLYPLANSTFQYSCTEERIELIADISNSSSSNSGSRFTIDYEVLDRRIVIMK